jgi:hypothetical protein
MSTQLYIADYDGGYLPFDPTWEPHLKLQRVVKVEDHLTEIAVLKAEVERLRALVKDAYEVGLVNGGDEYGYNPVAIDDAWEQSKIKRALNPAPEVKP